MQDLQGKNAVVTGGASGIGLAIAKKLAGEGMNVVVADVEPQAMNAAVAEIEAVGTAGARAVGVATDVSDFDSVVALEVAATDAFGPVHVLCNNAGVGANEDVPMWELPLNDWRWTMAVNVWGVIHGVKAFVPGMLAHGEEGHVVNTSSGNGGLILLPTTPIYSTSKSAVSTMTEALHLQLVQMDAKIRASVLYPGPHIVASNIFDAKRNRPAEFEREMPQAGPDMTLDMIRSLVESMGTKLQTTEPAEVAEFFLEGIREDAYFLMARSEDADARFRERTDNVLERRNPVPPKSFL